MRRSSSPISLNAYCVLGNISNAARCRPLSATAEALDCTLVYALVPNKPLEQVVFERAGELAAEQLKRVNHTMRLEAQGVEDEDLADEYARLRSEILAGNPSRLWKRE